MKGDYMSWNERAIQRQNYQERQGTVAEQAMRALRYLEDKLRKQKPWLRVQKMTELHDPEFYKVYIPSDCVVWSANHEAAMHFREVEKGMTRFSIAACE